MSATPPVFLILDIGPLSAATPREWLEFSRAGSCVIPQNVYEEMRFLFDRSPDPDLERLARDFNRFYPTSGWKISEANGAHELLRTSTGQSLTKRARISLASARCAYGMALSFPNSLVVFVTSDRALLQKVYDIQSTNFCAVTGPSLLQWCRTGQRPIAVIQKLQQLKASGATGIPLNSNLLTQPSKTSSSTRTSTTIQSKPTGRRAVIRDASGSALQATLSQVFSLITALALLGVAGYLLNNVIRQANVQFNSPPAQSSP